METSENLVQEVLQEVLQEVAQVIVNEVENVIVQNVENVVQNVENVVENVQNVVENVQNVVQNVQNVKNETQQNIPLVHYSSPTSLIFTVCGQVSHNLGKNKITVNKSNIISIVHTVMGAIETVYMTKELKGKQKKDLAIDCLNWFVDQQEELSIEEKSFIRQSIKLLAPDAIDVIADIGNGISDLVKNGVGNLVKNKICCTIL